MSSKELEAGCHSHVCQCWLLWILDDVVRSSIFSRQEKWVHMVRIPRSWRFIPLATQFHDPFLDVITLYFTLS